MSKNYANHNFKVVLLGRGCVGKTSLVLRYCENKFNNDHLSTLQASFLIKRLSVNGSSVNLSIWDTAGQERFHALGPIYYREANGAVIVYDLTDSESLSKAKSWIHELKTILGDSVCLALVANKCDLLKENKSHPSSNPLVAEAIAYCKTLTKTVHYYVSAKLNLNLDEMFLDLTRRMIEENKSNEINSNDINQLTNHRVLRITDSEDNNEETKKCNC